MNSDDTKYLEEALAMYNLPGARAELIRHNENMTFHAAGRYLLRIHRHAEGFSTKTLYEGLDRLEIYRAELDFLLHLRRKGIDVQTPVPNQKGELVTLLDGRIPATMLTWIPGHSPEKKDASPALCRRMGELTARLHHASRDFKPSCALKYDDVLCARLDAKVRLLEAQGILDAPSARILEKSCALISRNLKSTKDTHFPVHADLSLSNLLITRSGLVPIDFSLFGIGDPMLDISALFCNINGIENRKAVAEGYRGGGGTISFPLLDCCFVLNILLCILIHCDGPEGREWIQGRSFPRWRKETFVPFAQGKPLFSPDFVKIEYTDG